MHDPQTLLARFSSSGEDSGGGVITAALGKRMRASRGGQERANEAFWEYL